MKTNNTSKVPIFALALLPAAVLSVDATVASVQGAATAVNRTLSDIGGPVATAIETRKNDRDNGGTVSFRDETEKPFSFKQPKSTLDILPLSEDQLSELNKIGQEYVDLIDGGERFETARAALEKELIGKNETALEDARKALFGARDAQYKAESDLAAAKEKEIGAQAKVNELEGLLKAVENSIAAVEAAEKKDIEDANLQTKALKRAKSEVETAGKAAEKAAAAASKAVAVRQEATDKVAAATAAATEAAEAVEKAQKTVSEKAQLSATATRVRREAAEAASAAKDASVQAADKLATAERAQRAAEKAAERARRAAERASAKAAEATKAAKAAADKAAADKTVDPKTLGFWARRSFNPERSVANAAKAAANAEESGKIAAEAQAAAEKAAAEAAAATAAVQPVREAAEAARKLAETRFAESEMAVANAKKAGDAHEEALSLAKRAARDAERAEEDKQSATTAKVAAEAAEKAANQAAAEAKTIVDELANHRDRLEKATDPTAIAHEAHWREHEDLDKQLGILKERKERADAELEEARKIDLSAQEELLNKSREEAQAAWNTFREKERVNSRTSEKARLEAARGEKDLEKKVDEKRDAFFKDYRELVAPGVYFGSDQGPTVRREEADRAFTAANERATKAAAAVLEAKEFLKKKNEIAKAAKSALKNADEENRTSAQETYDQAQAAVGAAEEALAAAKAAAEKAESEAKQAGKNKSAAEKAVRRADGVMDETVEDIKEAFIQQVEEAQAKKQDSHDRRTMSAGQQRRKDAREAKAAYDKAKNELDEAKAAWILQKTRYEGESSFRRAGEEYAAARMAFNEAENRYQEFFGDRNTFETEPLSVEESNDLYESDAVKEDLHGYQIHGDRRWLAATSVNGENLLETLRDEILVAGLPVAASIEAGRINLSDADAAAAVEAAAAAVRRRAVYGGFYFAGLDVDAAKKEIFVDKGRFGPINVSFIRSEDEIPDENGRLFDADDILDKLGANATVDPVKEGEAFNFVRFRETFNALNANPDIRRADVEFRPSDAFNYGYEDEDPGFTNKNTRAVTADLNVREKGFPAPIHGVIGVDNFNSMGESDAIAGEGDTWMARATLQHLDLFGLGHALSLSGNYSLGGSLWGAAASYYIPRETGSKWSDGAWHRLSGWSWTVHGGYTDVDQADVVPDLDVLGTGYYAGIAASSRVADFGGSTLDLALGFTWRYVESSVRVGGQEIMMGPNEGDGYTIMPLSIALMYADKDLDVWRGRTFATAELAYNLGGSTADELRYFRYAIDENRYLVARLQLARLQLLWEESQSFLLPRVLFLKADAQWASAPVVGTEQFGLGGHSTVRGYVERQFMGDTGAAGTIEFRTPIGLGWLDSSTPDPFRASDRIQLVYFADLGWFTLEDGLGTDRDDSEFLASLGFGLRYSWDDLVLRLDWGYPLVTDDAKFESSSSGVIHASMQYQF